MREPAAPNEPSPRRPVPDILPRAARRQPPAGV